MKAFCNALEHDWQPVAQLTASANPKTPAEYCAICGLVVTAAGSIVPVTVDGPASAALMFRYDGATA